MKSIFDLVTADAIVSYWETVASNAIPYLGEELWPSQQKLGLNIDWIKGAHGLPIVLKPSAYDVAAKKRNRIGFERLQAKMPYFKEAVYIDEELRQSLNMVIETGNQTYIDAVMNNVFRDEVNLLEGARAQRERLRMSVLTTGAISISANGQDYEYDYGVPTNHQVDVTSTSGYGGKAWSDKTAPIIDDIKTLMDLIEDETGVRPTRAVMRRKTFAYLRKNDEIRQAIRGTDSTAPVSDGAIKSYVSDELGLTIAIYDKKYIDEKGQEAAFVPENLMVLLPAGNLGTGWFGTTPEQSDLMSGTAANVRITDVGVAVTTSKKVDPVNVETKVSMIYLPDFPMANMVGYMDVA